MKYYIVNDDGDVEEIELSVLKYSVEKGSLSLDTLVCTDENNTWIPYSEHGESLTVRRAISAQEGTELYEDAGKKGLNDVAARCLRQVQLAEARRTEQIKPVVSKYAAGAYDNDESPEEKLIALSAESYTFTICCAVFMIVTTIILSALILKGSVSSSAFLGVLGFIPIFVICIIIDLLVSIRKYVRVMSIK